MSVAQALRPFGDASPAWVLIATPAFQDTAAQLVAAMPQGTIELLPIRWSHFADRTPSIALEPDHVFGRDVILLAEVAMDDIMSYFSVVYAVPRYFARTFLVITPFFPTGTMERVEVEGEIATAMTLARMISATPSPTVGSTCFMFYDIHALATRFFFRDTIKPWMATAVPLLLQYIAEEMHPDSNPSGRPVLICYPDEGAKKRFRSLFGDSWDVCVCAKTRVGDKREVVLQEGDPAGRDVVIVDDMVQSGGTMLECVSMLAEKGAKSVSCYVTHGVFPEDTWRRFTNEEMEKSGRRPLRHFVLTDSIPSTAAKLRGVEPFRVLSLAPRLAELLRTTVSGSFAGGA
jgi:ribose-phosphate pyrophosphokinase